MKVNWVGLISAALIFASLLLPWLSATYYQLVGAFPNFEQDYSLNAELSINYFGFIGHANGITQMLLFPYWFNWVFFAMLLIAGLIALKGSFSKKALGRKLMVLSGILAIICSPLFYVVFLSTLLSLPLKSSNLLFNIFSSSSFGLTALDPSSLHTKTGSSFYWLPVIAGILAIIAIKFFSDKNANTNNSERAC